MLRNHVAEAFCLQNVQSLWDQAASRERYPSFVDHLDEFRKHHDVDPLLPGNGSHGLAVTSGADVDHVLCLHVFGHMGDSVRFKAAFGCLDSIDRQSGYILEYLVGGFQIHGNGREPFVQLVTTGVIVDSFVKRHLPHNFSDGFRVVNDILIGEGVFVNGITGRAEDDQPFGAECFG
mgnify:FL=1